MIFSDFVQWLISHTHVGLVYCGNELGYALKLKSMVTTPQNVLTVCPKVTSHAHDLIRLFSDVFMGNLTTSLTCVGAHVHLGVESDCSVGTPALRPLLDALIKGARVMPGQSNQNRVAVARLDELFQLLSEAESISSGWHR